MLMKYKDFKMMSQTEMKLIKGGSAPVGGTCRHHEMNLGVYYESECMTREAAINAYNACLQNSYNTDCHWCCDSCASPCATS